jgi:hypothetical protein
MLKDDVAFTLDGIEDFLLRVPDVSSKPASEMIDVFLYFLTVEKGIQAARAGDIAKCFVEARIPAYSNISAYLSRESTVKRRRLFRSKTGYSLSRNREKEVRDSLLPPTTTAVVPSSLRDYLVKISDTFENAFLRETILCFESGAWRGSIVLMWCLTMYHISKYVLIKKLTEFNAAIAKHPDKRLSGIIIQTLDDFEAISDSKFIELVRSARIVTNDVRKILDEKLGIRNSAAHPSTIVFSDLKANEFILDLVENVLLKYKY